jgi:hypothetical protein
MGAGDSDVKVVLYTEDFEPITVLDMPMWAIDRLQLGERIVLPQRTPFELCPPYKNVVIRDVPQFKKVQIWGERLLWKGCCKLVLVTNDETGALALDASWLPGQQYMVNGYKENVRGLAALLCAVMEGYR